jgi:hypothetical protein
MGIAEGLAAAIVRSIDDVECREGSGLCACWRSLALRLVRHGLGGTRDAHPPHPHSQEFGSSVAIGDARKALIGEALDALGTD